MESERRTSAPRDVLPRRAEMESRLRAEVVTYESKGQVLPGGMCGCCGGGPNSEPDWRDEPWYIYRAGLCDGDGVYYSMLCEGCLDDIRAENAKRPQTERDRMAQLVTELLGDDLDGADGLMEDLAGC